MADSVGVCTHFGYSDTIYGAKWEQVRTLLAESGVRYVRDAFHPRMEEIYKQYGIRAILVTDPRQGPLDQVMKTFVEQRPLIAAVEGPNEGNLFWPQQNVTYKGQGWPGGVKLFQDELYADVKNNPALKDVSVIAASTGALGANLAPAPLSSFDDLVMHSYPGGKLPSDSLDDPDFSNIRNAFYILGRGGRARPIVATETGYHTCLANPATLGPEQPGVSLRADAKYIPRLIAEYFNAGVGRTVIYEFGCGTTTDPAKDPEACFGLLNQDATPKPAYSALRDLRARSPANRPGTLPTSGGIAGRSRPERCVLP